MSGNGRKLRQSVGSIAAVWSAGGIAPAGFPDWLRKNVSFPATMIDKITPRPEKELVRLLEARGLEDMQPVERAAGAAHAPYVNAEDAEYLVIEDAFPNGRPPLEAAGVIMTDAATVEKAERMKMTACLNPLHTALAIFGCLLGYRRISAEMSDPELTALIAVLGEEGLQAVEDPGIIDPRAFLRELVEERLPNPFIPDTPQRIACDTSQKLPVRYGETLKTMAARGPEALASLKAIPLTVAGWLRYLLGVDDEGRDMALSPDPRLEECRAVLSGVRPGDPKSGCGRADRLLRDTTLFGIDLYESPLRAPIEEAYLEMLAGPGAVRSTLRRHLGAK